MKNLTSEEWRRGDGRYFWRDENQKENVLALLGQCKDAGYTIGQTEFILHRALELLERLSAEAVNDAAISL